MPGHVLKLLHAVAPETPDAELLARFVAARDEVAFAELVRRHGPLVYRVCRRLSRRSADDAFQATFLVLACRAAGVRKAASVGSWLVGAAGRVARQMARRDGRYVALAPDVPGPVERPADPFERAELAAALDDELSRLPEHLRAPLVLCLVGGRTQEQAAAELGSSVRTLRRRLERAKAVLRARLERRGIVPAVAGGLVSAVGAVSAVPPGLGRLAAGGALEFLAGAAPASPAAVVAKGVVDSMARLKVSAAVALAVTAVALGLGGAGQPPAAPPERPLASSVPPAPAPQPETPVPDGAAASPGADRPMSAYRSTNFLVSAPTHVIARAVAAEAEYQRAQLGVLWLGAEPPAWNRPCEIVVRRSADRATGATEFDFRADVNGGKPLCRGARVELAGPFEDVLSTTVPREVARVLLGYHFGRPLPRWVDEGIAMTFDSAEDQFHNDIRCRELLNAGRGIRCRVLFRMTEYPRDASTLRVQGHSVVRFLLARTPAAEPARVPGTTDAGPAPGLGILTKGASTNPHRALLDFIRAGFDSNTAEPWDRAAKQVYGFDSASVLEDAWLESLRTPPVRPAKGPKGSSDLIPPTRLPDGDVAPVPAKPKDGPLPKLGGGPGFISARKFCLSVQIPPERQAALRGVTLFTCRGGEATWFQAGTAAPDATGLAFDAPEDGLYWFDIVENPKDRSEAPTVTLKPTFKVVVDTTPPVVRITEATRAGNEIRVAWAVTEANPGTLKVRWQATEPASPWQDVSVPSTESTVTFDPGVKKKVRVQVLATDAAGNESRVEAVVE
ncbi:sigma-70 family RNA polymerase sigma factor [Gemmata sp. JC717]|uniref:sigma-70 family RNA polymerase sigma factor n=1 Tax=Gemmata algarum TaxID=2975278 RepID=UPI0021BB86C5|nr:sigma-70 family RNA polymerase sigma factor [Gemmata algarum]MDY3551233.1 sigma-70 family RNA polymerase sigma factor [Gemmata algarum]